MNAVAWSIQTWHRQQIPPENDIACLAVLCSSSCPQCTSLQGILYVLGLLKQLLGAVKLQASIHHGTPCHRSGY